VEEKELKSLNRPAGRSGLRSCSIGHLNSAMRPSGSVSGETGTILLGVAVFEPCEVNKLSPAPPMF
jgi:hypothetical protein